MINTLITWFNAILVFGTPTVFGWVLLRRVVRETNLFVLIPGSVTFGLAALMALVNELRFFLEQERALWFAYKLLLVVSLVLILIFPRIKPVGFPACCRRTWQILLVAAGTIAVGFYYGVPAFSGYLNDGWWYHYPAAVQIQTTALFPLHHPFAIDGPLYYHYGPDILAASWSSLLQQSVQIGYATTILLLAPCAFLLAFALLSRLARNYWAALLGAVFLIAGGNLRFLQFLTGHHEGALGALKVFNSQTVQGLQQLMFTPSHAVGIPLVLALLTVARHVLVRPSWLLAGIFGLFLGTLTLVAEWYFFPLLGGSVLVFLWSAWKRYGLAWPRLSIALFPGLIAIGCGTFNHSYLAGTLDHFWMPASNIEEMSDTRQILAEIQHGGIDDDSVKVRRPQLRVPNLVPLRLNLDHLGYVPSWENAASDESSYIPLWSASFLMEAAPVLLLGIPFAVWLTRSRRNLSVVLLLWLATVSAVPPILLDWGYRSADFLRFFTASFCFSALLFGWLVGLLLSMSSIRLRVIGAILAACGLITPIGVGIIGLLPGTLTTAREISDTARSLSQIQQASTVAPSNSPDIPSGVFEHLAKKTGDYLFPFSRGRDRAIVIVPLDQVPETRYFPQWLKMTTLSRLLIPVGWHWHDSLYSAYYREAVTTLDAKALVSLDAQWIIVSNVFQSRIPDQVATALADRTRFKPAGTVREGDYYMKIFRVVP